MYLSEYDSDEDKYAIICNRATQLHMDKSVVIKKVN